MTQIIIPTCDIYFFSCGSNSLLRESARQPSTGLTSTCSQTEVKYYLASLRLKCDQHIASPVAFSFLNRNYLYKSAATQIPTLMG